jgi:hypothetical protein
MARSYHRAQWRQVHHKVDTAWNEAWVGTDQDREYRINGTKLQVLSPPAPNPAFGAKLARGIFTFERESNQGATCR